MNQNLLPISTIIKLAAQQGVSLGNGKPENRIAYFIKTGLLPHAVRRKNPATDKIEAHFPISILEKIKEINHLKRNGASVLNLANGSSSLGPNLSRINNYGLKTDVKFLIGTLVLLIFFLSFAALYLTWNYSPFPQTLSERIASIEAGLKDKASGLLVNLVEEGVKNKVSVGEQVLLAEIPQDLSINSLTLSDDLRVGGDTSIEGTLTVSSESNLYSLNVNNNLNVTGDSLLTGSLNVGGTINGSTLSSTALTFTGTSASIYPSSSDTSLFLNGGTTGTVNIGNSSTGDIHIGGGTQSSGCTITNNNGSLNCSSDITSSGNLRVNGGTLSTTQTTLSIDVADSGSINFRDSSNTLVSITDEGTTGNINVTGIYKIGGTTGKTIATCGSSQYLGGIAITGGIVTTLGNCNDVSSTTGTDLTLSGDLAVNGGDITSTSSTFNLLNQPTTLNIGSTNVTRAVNIGTGTNADTINIGTGTGTADTINIGGISGTTVNITGGTVNITGNLVSTGTVQGTRLISTIATGTAPLTVASTTVVPNLNASLLEGNSASTVMSQPQPNLVLNSDFGRRNKWMTFMPETFTDTSGWTLVQGSSLGTVSGNVLTAGNSGTWGAAAGLSTWRDVRMSALIRFTDTGTAYEGVALVKWIDANNNVGVDFRNTDGYINLRKTVSGTTSEVAVGPTPGAPTLNNWYWLEVEFQGTTVIGKVYSCGASACAKSSATLLGTSSIGTVSDSILAAGKVAIITPGYNGAMQTALQIGGLSTGDGGVYVEGWGPESWDVAFGGTKGGQAFGFDEAADSGPLSKQYTPVVYIPATSRTLTLTHNGYDGGLDSSQSYIHSGYVKNTSLGGSGTMLTFRTAQQNSASTDGTLTDVSDAAETTWTRKTSSSFTTASTARRFSQRILVNPASTRTGTVRFSLPQLERAADGTGTAVSTPWKNAPADDGPIVWELIKNDGANFTQNGNDWTAGQADPRNLAGNFFVPWDGSLMMQSNAIVSTNTLQGYVLGSFFVGGSNIASPQQTLFISPQATANYVTLLTGVGTKTVSAGKHRVALHVNTDGGVTLTLWGSNATGYDSRPSRIRITATRGKFDLAEEYSVSDRSINAGDIVRLAPGSGSTTVEKTIGGYSQDILGIISTDPGITLGNYNSSDGSIIDGNYQSRYGQGNTLRPVALQGRVPVKVTSENGPIKRGDILTSSATLPGYAMKAIKAGRSIGVAMEPFGTDVPQDAGSSSLGSSLSPTVDSVTGLPVEEVKVGKVMTFVNLSFYDPQVYITDSGTLSVIKVGSTPVLLSSSSTGGVGGDITIDNSTTETKQSFTYQIQDRVTKEIIERIGAFNNLFVANLKVGSIDVDKIESKEIDQLKLSLTDLLTNQASLSGRIEFLEKIGTESAVLSASVSGLLNEPISEDFTTLNSLTVSRRTLLNDLGITGTVTNGLLSIDGLNSSITSLTDIKLKTPNGLITIDREGNVTAQKFIIDNSNLQSSSIGVGTINVGDTSVVISTTAVTNKSAIFITSKSKTGNKTLRVSDQKEKQGFTVSIEEPYIAEIIFNWFILN